MVRMYRVRIRSASRTGSRSVKVLAISRAHARLIATTFGYSVVSVRPC